MKGDQQIAFLDHLVTVINDHVNTKVAAVAALRPTESFPTIAEIYVDEEDYDKAVLTPCVLLFPGGPVVLDSMSDAVIYEFPVDICAFNNPTTAGLPVLHRQLHVYMGCLADLLSSEHNYEAGFWTSVKPLEAVDPQNLADERFGTLGRVKGFRFGFQIQVSYP